MQNSWNFLTKQNNLPKWREPVSRPAFPKPERLTAMLRLWIYYSYCGLTAAAVRLFPVPFFQDFRIYSGEENTESGRAGQPRQGYLDSQYFLWFKYPYFYEKEMDNIKYKTFEDVTEVYGKTNLCKICNIKQIITYAKLGVQPVWIDEGYGGKLIAYYFIPETKVAWKYWLENRPDTGQAENAADRDGNRSAGGE